MHVRAPTSRRHVAGARGVHLRSVFRDHARYGKRSPALTPLCWSETVRPSCTASSPTSWNPSRAWKAGEAGFGGSG
jgi:hypothetical protein